MIGALSNRYGGTKTEVALGYSLETLLQTPTSNHSVSWEAFLLLSHAFHNIKCFHSLADLEGVLRVPLNPLFVRIPKFSNS